ncbi:hypothetical protein BJ742DRAFT_413932 [Cladochytrium replicatum]|nr:hypothetical protein BJ742DRAFT_413932 [Cladochytrium replicatum]
MTPKAIEQSEAFERKMEELAILVRTLLDGGSIYLPGYGEDDLDAPIQATADQKEPVEDRISSLELQLERLISLQQLSSANRSGSPLSESFVVVSGSSGIRTSDADAALVLERVGSLEARMGRLEEKFVAFQVVFDEFATAFEVQQRKWANAQVERSANRGVSPVPLTPVTGSWTNPLGDGGPQQGARRESGGQGNTSAINTSLKAFADMFSSLASPGAKKAGE